MLDATGVYDRLKQFDIPEQDAQSMLIKAEYLTPDSWAYLTIKAQDPEASKYFVLYSEDFIQSLDYIREVVEKWSESKIVSLAKPHKALGTEDEQAANDWAPFAMADKGNYTFLFEVKPTDTNQSYWAQRN